MVLAVAIRGGACAAGISTLRRPGMDVGIVPAEPPAHGVERIHVHVPARELHDGPRARVDRAEAQVRPDDWRRCFLVRQGRLARRGGLEPPTPRFVAWCSGPTELPAPAVIPIYSGAPLLASPWRPNGPTAFAGFLLEDVDRQAAAPASRKGTGCGKWPFSGEGSDQVCADVGPGVAVGSGVLTGWT